MSIVQINGKGVHVLEMNTEARQTVVMVHGMFTNMSVFYFYIAPELAKYFHVVVYDLKSHGLSERVESGYNLETMSNELIALTEALGLSKIHLIGYSFGGLIALKTAMLYPDKIDKLCIIDTPKPEKGGNTEMLKKYGDEFIEQYLNSYTESTFLKPGKRQLAKIKGQYDYLLNQTTIKEDLEMDNDLFDKISDNPPLHDSLLLYGLESDCTHMGDFLQGILPNSELFKGKGDHNIPIQNPQWLGEKLTQFLR